MFIFKVLPKKTGKETQYDKSKKKNNKQLNWMNEVENNG